MSTVSLAFGPPESQAQFRRLVAAELLKLRKRRGLLLSALGLTILPMIIAYTVLLIVHAANDPFIRIVPETRRKIVSNPHIKFVEVEDGGHCAFVGGRNGADDGFWAESQIVDFLRRF